ncbi:FOG: Transposon-encoded proteins with TYA, reverse transcriptase, integrase domains in various combinations [Plasmopara halstedii]|uniref:FOG: Transposon-encoded proteins with TYA, reverse transcriptase, integrase domains in various combinations n=1 Tax=Plasmopara halstedii TaxID=4781 RepID=A0A0P1A755_PLAHL|nr:FOG: Transposon-encoded proteins with TYA, reverse transcriptase, integrase domains in various combinations [Plasmopara halstedii]CEG35814.1 FOG: Transposon-encoded proteins with TYA, reverse transcriptase, integrase domains in various combinations [Plasmopara halstedii]|eukprot:XP_024572183.1 FOG: Transposon-encoded proteins with TYA, reverse transcriptase, integrase domains in various combinations [Plasmopara halstedii]
MHDKSPYQVWTGKKPLMANLKKFGCHAYVNLSKEKRSEFGAKHRSGRLLVSRDAQFMKIVFDGAERTDQHEVVIQDEEEQMSSQSDETDNEDDDDAALKKDFASGSKRHNRSESLGKAVEVSRPKQSRRFRSFEERSAAAQDFEAAYVMDSVGEMSTTFKSAMEFSDVGK